MKSNLSTQLLNGFVFAGFVLTVLALIALPFYIVYLGNSDMLENPEYFTKGVFAAIYVCAIPYIAGLVQLKKIVKLFRKRDIFSLNTSRAFSILSKLAFVEAGLLVVILSVICIVFNFCFSWQSILVFFIAVFIFITGGLICICMCQAFKQAAEMKDEIELTF